MSLTIVRGQFVNQAGQPVRGQILIELTRSTFDAVSAEKIIPSRQVVALDADGRFELGLWPNARGRDETRYRLTVAGLVLLFSLPDQPEVELAEVVTLPG